MGQGQQFVTFGLHPDTGRPYYWTGDTPLDVPFTELPLVDEGICADLISDLSTLLPPIGTHQRRSKTTRGEARSDAGPVRNDDGIVIDGRDSWLSSTAFHIVHDALDRGTPLHIAALADHVWQRFASSTDLLRPKKDGRTGYSYDDALQKVQDKLSLHEAGRLPPRTAPQATPVQFEPGLGLERARSALVETLADFCGKVELWLASDRENAAPRFGIRATVGLGKSAVSRIQLLALQARLRAARLPHRVMVFVQSLALADEAAASWVAAGARVAVHWGYEAKKPGGVKPMCRDIDMVRLAVASGQPVFPNACMRRGGPRCHNFENCDKQENLREVEGADIVLAAYDSLFTGLPIDSERFALLVIDEGCWERAPQETKIGINEINAIDAVDAPRMVDPEDEVRAWADLFRLRNLLIDALKVNGAGPMSRQSATLVGLTAADCTRGAALEVQLRVDPGLRPGLPQGARKQAAQRSLDANRSLRRERLFLSMARLLDGEEDQDGRVRIQWGRASSADRHAQLSTASVGGGL